MSQWVGQEAKRTLQIPRKVKISLAVLFASFKKKLYINLLKSISLAESHSPSSFLDGVDNGGPQAGVIKACSTPVSAQNRHLKEAERARPSSSTGHHTPAMLSPGSSSSFPRPIYSVPLLSHVPLVRPPPPPQLHPGVVQRMIAQGVQPQPLGPALLQTGGKCVYLPNANIF